MKGLVGLSPISAFFFLKPDVHWRHKWQRSNQMSHVIDCLDTDDDVMAEKGFNEFAARGETVNIPSFPKRKT